MTGTPDTSKRPQMTTFDYAVVAVSPALIMTLVGSLIFFLLEVFYQGGYDTRLRIIFALWVFAAVLISRISMAEGSSRAMLFALPLSCLMVVAIGRFVEFRGGLAPLSFPINLALLGLVWWSTNKLTWDCTLVADRQDASGQGLLRTIQGRPTKKEKHATPSDTSQEEKTKSWWQRRKEKRERPHPHGVWVVYFSVAALPLFGIGQAFVSDATGRTHVFFLLCVYLASGFGLLVTTSLLGLRRYLRQRRIQMPHQITAIWLSLGGVIIAVLMAAVLLLPRSFSQLALPESPFGSKSPEELAETDNAPRSGESEEGIDRTSQDATAESTDEESQSDSSAGNGEAEYDEGSSPSDDAQSSGAEGDGSSTADPTADESSIDGSSGQAGEQSSFIDPSEIVGSIGEWLIQLLRWIFFLAVLIVGLVVAWKYRAEIREAWLRFLGELRELWQRLFARKPKPVTQTDQESAAAPDKRRPFCEFTNPFLSGAGKRLSPDELVRYTFQAFEVWAAERGYPREPQQTPHEFAQQVGLRSAALLAGARQLADLYCQAAYAPDSVSASSVAALEQLWGQLSLSPANGAMAPT